MWSINLEHFLDEKGSTSELPEAALEIAEHFGSIVSKVTLDFTGQKVEITSVNCRNPEIKDCNGTIIGVLGEKLEEINWYCGECNDSGAITGWGDTLWNCSELAVPCQMLNQAATGSLYSPPQCFFHR